jgi:serine/threonine protein kinase
MSVTASPQPEPNGELTPIDPSDAYRFERVRVVLGELMELPAGQRMARLDELAGSDPPLRAAVAELLALAEAADRAGFLDAGVDEEDDGPARDTPDPLPERIGPYRVLARLGEGGTGVVYLGESPAPMHRRAAVKLSRSSLRGQAAYRADVEAEALASFNHPGIAQVFETGVLDDGRRWTACELVDGDWISRGSAARGWRASVELLAQAAEAVHHAHQRGVVHRDLKPSNLLVERDAGTPRVKVIDFGVARLLAPRSGADAATEPGLLVGTLAYMSPEQLGAGSVDARTDVYGLGLVACEVLTGKPPPGRSGGLAELMKASKLRGCPKLTGCGGHERDLEAVIAKATDPEPGARYPSMQHLADDLRRVLASEPVSARRPGPLWRLRLYTTRHPVLSGLSVVVVLVIASLLAALSASRANLASELRDQGQLLSELTTDTLAGLREIRGTHAQREAMVGTLLDRHARRLAANPGDPDLRSLQARLLRERGDLAASVGRFDDAMSDLSASRDLFRGLVDEGFGGGQVARLYAEGIVRTGDVVLERDRAGGALEAMAAYRSALVVQENALRSDPASISLRDDLCWSYDRIGDMGDKWVATPDAELEPWLHTRIELSEALLAADPTRSLSRYNLATGHLRLARFLGTRDRNEEAAAAIAAGLPHIRAAVRAEPHRTMFVQILIGLLSWDTTVQLRLGRDGGSPASVAEMVDVARAHARLLQGDLMAEGTFVNALTQAAGTLADIGRMEEAQLYAAESLERIRVFRTMVPPSRLAELDEGEAWLQELLSQAP